MQCIIQKMTELSIMEKHFKSPAITFVTSDATSKEKVEFIEFFAQRGWIHRGNFRGGKKYCSFKQNVRGFDEVRGWFLPSFLRNFCSSQSVFRVKSWLPNECNFHVQRNFRSRIAESAESRVTPGSHIITFTVTRPVRTIRVPELGYAASFYNARATTRRSA